MDWDKFLAAFFAVGFPLLLIGVRRFLETCKLVHERDIDQTARRKRPESKLRQYSAQSFREAVFWGATAYTAGLLYTSRLARPILTHEQLMELKIPLTPEIQRVMDARIVEVTTIEMVTFFLLLQIVLFGAYMFIHKRLSALTISSVYGAPAITPSCKQLSKLFNCISIGYCWLFSWPFTGWLIYKLA